MKTDSVEVLLHQWPSHPREPVRAWQRWGKDGLIWGHEICGKPSSTHVICHMESLEWRKLGISPPGIEGRCLTCENADHTTQARRVLKNPQKRHNCCTFAELGAAHVAIQYPAHCTDVATLQIVPEYRQGIE